MNTIRARLLTSMIMTGLVPLILVLVPLGSVLNRNLLEQEQEKLVETSRQLGRLVAEVTDRTSHELASLQSNPLLSDPNGDIEVKLKEMHRLVRIFEVYSDISLYDSEGFLLGSTAEDHPTFREYSDWFHSALKGTVSLSHPQRILGKEGLHLTVYLPIESGKGAKAASLQVLKARLSFARVISLLGDGSLSSGNTVYLLDALGNTLSGGDPEHLMEKFDSEVPSAHWFEQRTGTYQPKNGPSYLFAREVLPPSVTNIDSPWIVLSMKPMEEVTAMVRQGILALIAAAVCMMAMAAALAVFLSKLISRPLERIGDAAASVAAGNLSARAEADEGSTEMRVLASIFNRMVGEIADHRESLEQLVASRTESLHLSQSELERANARLQAAISSTKNGFLVEDLEGGVSVVNGLFLSFLGASPDHPAAVSANEILDAFETEGGIPPGMAQAWRETRADVGIIDQEVAIGSDEKRVLQVYSAPIRDRRGNLIGRVWSLQDLTEQRKLEEGLRQSQKMEAVGQLAGGIAHDFNNLLAGVLGNLALVKMDLGEEGSGEARESLNHAIKAGERAAELVKQLLGFSRRSRMDLKPCDANLVLTEVRDILAATIDRRIQIELDLNETPWRVMADVGMLGQVFMNMAVNAKDAMPHGGRLFLRSRNRKLSPIELRSHPEIEPGDFVCLSVEDEGDGIPLKVQAKIFEPFFTTKEPGKGTGLGLATSFGIVKQLGGWIDFQSEPGKGTCFDIYLPRSKAAEAGDTSALLTASVGEPQLAPSRRGETILLVDDEALVRRIGRTLLTKLGYEILEAADGLEALEICRVKGDSIGLVLLDLTMPNLTGKETFARLHEMLPELPVLICSGYLVDLNEFTQACGACPDGFVQKPYSFADMAEMVWKTLDRQSHVAA
ncbi:MAG: ATP-binding protein [Verrucomicrobiales bacterium]|nr:ATP-binding protein [Verrucomicrobiales bacterium]